MQVDPSLPSGEVLEVHSVEYGEDAFADVLNINERRSSSIGDGAQHFLSLPSNRV